MLTDRSWRRSWRSVASVIAVVQTLASARTAAPASRAIVECRPQDDETGRIYRVVDRGDGASPRWTLTLEAQRLSGRTVELPLPDAVVEQTADRVSVSSRSANGGLTVSVVATARESRLDVFVNFELEVNVWRDLSPDVEQMNTDGPLAHANCRLLPSGAALP